VKRVFHLTSREVDFNYGANTMHGLYSMHVLYELGKTSFAEVYEVILQVHCLLREDALENYLLKFSLF